MKSSPLFFRRMILVCAGVLVTVALVLALGIMQPVKAEVSLGATPERAVQGFWVNIGLSLLAAAILVSIAIRSNGRSWISTSILVIAGLIVLLLGIALADAGSAYQSHGPSMHFASILLFICAASDLLAGSLVFTMAYLQPK